MHRTKLHVMCPICGVSVDFDMHFLRLTFLFSFIFCSFFVTGILYVDYSFDRNDYKQIHVHLVDIRYCNRHTLKINSIAEMKRKETKKRNTHKNGKKISHMFWLISVHKLKLTTHRIGLLLLDGMQSSNANESALA